jgi:fermentation-respiration switch protein FrsA (DUF1100 family)
MARLIIRLIAVLTMVGFGTIMLGSYAERWLIYPFDATRVAPVDAGLDGVQEILLEANDETLVIWVAPAQPGKPVILYFHGNAGNLAARAGRFRHFLRQGYGIVAPAYRGSSGSSGSPVQAALERDALAVYDFAKSQSDAPLVVYGESLGTAVAIHLMGRLDLADRGDKPAAVILEAPFTSLADLADVHYATLAPYADKLSNQWASIAQAKAALDMPLLILHGTADRLIPIAMGQAILAAAPARQKRLITIKGADHVSLWHSDVLPQIWRFIDRHARPW